MATVFIRNMVVSAHETSAKSDLLHEETSHTLHTPAGSPFVLRSPPPRTGYKSQHSQASLLSNLLLLRTQPAQAFKTSTSSRGAARTVHPAKRRGSRFSCYKTNPTHKQRRMGNC
uniref:Uncharacterized protein n=1 Tax=Phocoena sinus TaxID=42100 RepID=A0A8C9E251_PHOSS